MGVYIFISCTAEGATANHVDTLQVNKVDITKARHDHALSLLTLPALQGEFPQTLQ